MNLSDLIVVYFIVFLLLYKNKCYYILFISVVYDVVE